MARPSSSARRPSRKSAPRRVAKAPHLSHVCEALQQLAPLHLAQSWDNVGLLAGDVHQTVRTALLCIDLTPPVVDEAIKASADLVIAYHPPIFKPIPRLTAQSRGPEAGVFRCIRAGMAIYSLHTALDAADGGTNDVLADLCGIKHTEPLEYIDAAAPAEVKLVTFVPAEHLDAVAEAMFTAGAGRIGDYSRCSYRLDGEGTFHGAGSTQPAVGQAGQFERVRETRLETVCPVSRLPVVLAALNSAHPYEEVAYDIYPLTARPVRGIGRHGELPRPVQLQSLARKLKRATAAQTVQIVGNPRQEVRRAIIVAGAGGSLPFKLPVGDGDVILTGEIRHHDALTILRSGCTAIALNHWTSERPVLQPVARRLTGILPGLTAKLSRADAEPFRPV